MNNFEYNELRAASWRRPLDPAEQEQVLGYWAMHPQAQADWEEDLVLTRQLRELPDAPLSSNFTSLVLQAVDAEAATQEASPPQHDSAQSPWSRWLARFAPRMAFGGVAFALAVAFFVQHQIQARKVMAGDVREFVQLATLPGPEVFEQFDAIQKLPAVASSSDEDLLAALR